MCRTYLARVLAVLAMLTAFSAAADEFVRAGYMHARRFGHTSTLLSDGRVLITGGEPDDHSGVLSSAEIYDPSTHAFTTTGSMHKARIHHSAVLLHDGTVLVVGGTDIFTNPPAPAEIYDPTSGTFTQVGRLTTERYQFTAAVLPSGKVVVAGGQGCCKYFSNGGSSSTSLNSVEVYDPDTQSFTVANPLSDYRGTTAWATLGNGGILIAGGSYDLYDGDNFIGVAVLSTADVLDPSTLEFSPTSGSMSVARNHAAAALLHDGRVLVAYGGAMPDGTELPPSAEIYDPTSDQFVGAGAPSGDRIFAPAATLPDGRVAFIGAVDEITDNFEDTAEIYDPAQDAFTTTAATMSTTRWLHQATELDDGSVLVTGGRGLYNIPLIGGELFVPSTVIVNAMFYDGFDASVSTSPVAAAATATMQDASSPRCADAHFPPAGLQPGVVRVMQLPDGTRCIRE